MLFHDMMFHDIPKVYHIYILQLLVIISEYTNIPIYVHVATIMQLNDVCFYSNIGITKRSQFV